MNNGQIAICHSSEKGCCITWKQAGHQNKISYEGIGLFLADVTVVL
jgi:hypothetical protein